jgi:hypothetical protein
VVQRNTRDITELKRRPTSLNRQVLAFSRQPVPKAEALGLIKLTAIRDSF